MDIEWSEPPAAALRRQHATGKYTDLAAALRAHPDRWAKVPDEDRTAKGAQGTAQNIRRGKVKGFENQPGQRFETAVDGASIWVRCVPVEGVKEDPAPREPPQRDGDGLARAVRAWAQDQGIPVSVRGRVAQELVDQYLAAQQGQEPTADATLG